MNLESLVRPNILKLSPYSSARSEFTGAASVFLDANENPFNEPFNRYPDPLQRQVKEGISKILDINPDRIFLGVGSDECIDLAYRIFCRPGIDNVVAMSPTYGMYEVCADINDIEYRKVALDDNFRFSADEMLAATDDNTKLMWICSPNNPTGNAAPLETIKDLCRRFKGIVMVDEAYGDFSEKGSLIDSLDELPNAIVMKTFSKAWGRAALRLGMAFASRQIIDLYTKVKYPYNVNALTQQSALEALEKYSEVTDWVSQLLTSRHILGDELKKLRCVHRIYPSDANFLLVKVDDADAIYNFLRQRGIIVRNRNKVEKCLGCLRITVGTAQENETLINAIKDYERK